jgi:hypothetical protein
MPKIWINGLMSGTLAPELCGSSYIRSSSGYTAKIDYSYKGWLGGKKNSFSASLFQDDVRVPLYILEGVWSGEYTIKNMSQRGETKKMDLASLKRTPFIVKPLEEQDDMESRKAWQHVSTAIERGDLYATSKEKSKIENEQRELRKKEKLEGLQFQRRYFSRSESNKVAEDLMEGLEKVMPFHRGEVDSGQNCVWLWDEKKYECVKREDGIRSPRGVSFDSGVGLSPMASL